MCHLTHNVMFAKHQDDQVKGKMVLEEFVEGSEEESDEEEEIVEHKCFVSAASKSPMTENVCDLLVFLNISSNSYNVVLSDIDDACSYLNDMLISMSSELEKTKVLLYDVRNKVGEKNYRIESLELKIMNIMIDRDLFRMETFSCKTTKHLL